MGILTSHIRLIARELTRHPVKGRVLTLGQQAVYADLRTVGQILRAEGCSLQPLPANLNTSTKIPREQRSPKLRNRTNAQALFSLLGAESVHVLDVSNYEEADILCDLNLPVEPRYHNMFDVVFDGGTLEHVFDFPTALASVTRMVSLGGSVILTNPVSNFIDHGFYSLSPTLYYDYFAANGFGECSCYLIESSHLLERPSRVYTNVGTGRLSRFISNRMVGLAFFARKLTALQQIEKPIQSLYLGGNEGVPNPRSNIGRTFLSVARFLKSYCPDWLIESVAQQGWYRGKRQGLRFLGKW